MVVIPDRASQRNNFQIIPLSRPRIERERDAEGWLVLLPGGNGWLVGDRRQALARVRRARRASNGRGGHEPRRRVFWDLSKKGRGRAQKSLDLIEAMYAAAEAAQPITGRGIGYKLFIAGLIPSMARSEMQRVYRLLKEAREEGAIPWEWIVDETRTRWNEQQPGPILPHMSVASRDPIVATSGTNSPPDRSLERRRAPFAACWQPVLDQYAVGFRVMHGFSSATSVHDVADDDDGREVIALYVGDYDPSGLFMSEQDLPSRLAEYDGEHVDVCRIALIREQVSDLPPFPVTDKRADPRFNWFRDRYGGRCWELDAMDPNDLRDCVQKAIIELIEPVAWKRCEVVNRAERRVVADDPSKVEGRAMTVVGLPREYREPPPPECEPQLELWPDLPRRPGAPRPARCSPRSSRSSLRSTST